MSPSATSSEDGRAVAFGRLYTHYCIYLSMYRHAAPQCSDQIMSDVHGLRQRDASSTRTPAMHAEMRVPHLRRIWDKDYGRALVSLVPVTRQANKVEARAICGE